MNLCKCMKLNFRAIIYFLSAMMIIEMEKHFFFKQNFYESQFFVVATNHTLLVSGFNLKNWIHFFLISISFFNLFLTFFLNLYKGFANTKLIHL